MYSISKFRSLLILIIAFVSMTMVAACTSTINKIPTATEQPISSETKSSPTPTPTAQPTVIATQTPLPGPTATPTALPIGQENIGRLRPIVESGAGTLGTIDISPDGSIIAVAGSKGFWLIDKFTFNIYTHVTLHAGAVQQIIWHPGGDQLATGGADGTIRIWDTAESGQVEQIALLAGHTASVNALSWSPNGAKIASGGEDQSIRIWNAGTYKNERVTNHTSIIKTLDWHPDSEKLLIGEYDGSVSITNGQTGEYYTSFFAHEGWLNTATWSPDGTSVVTGGLDRVLRIWDLTQELTLEERHSFETLYAINSAVWMPDGTKVAAAGGIPYQIEIFDLNAIQEDASPGASEATFDGHTSPIVGLHYASGDVLLTSSLDNTLRAWDTNNLRELRRLSTTAENAFTASLNTVDWSPDGSLAATGGADGKIQIWSANEGSIEKIIEGHTGAITSLDWSPGGNWIATGGGDNFTRIWNVETGELVQELRSEGGKVNAVAFSPFGNMLASGGFFRIAQVWPAGTDQLPLLIYPDVEITAFGWASSGTILAIGGNDGSVRLYNTQTGAESTILTREQNTNIVALSWEPLGGRIAAMDRRGTIAIWESSTGEVIARHEGDGRLWNGLTWAPHGVIATGNDDGMLMTFEANMLTPISIHAGHSGGVNDVAFTEKGNRLASVDGNGSFHTWETHESTDEISLLNTIDSGEPGSPPIDIWPPAEALALANSSEAAQLVTLGRGTISTYAVSGEYIAAAGGNGVWIYQHSHRSTLRYFEGKRTFGLAWSPDGQLLATRELQWVRIWDTASGQLLRVFPVGFGLRNALSWSPDSNILAIPNRNGEINLVNVANGKSIQRLNANTEIFDLEWEKSGRYLAVAAGSNILVWDVPSGEQYALLQGHTGTILQIAFHPDELLLLSAADDQFIRLWDLDSIASPEPPAEDTEISWPEVKHDAISVEDKEMLTGIAWSTDGSLFLSAHGSQSIIEWGTATRQAQNMWKSEDGRDFVLLDNGQPYVALSEEDAHLPAQDGVFWPGNSGSFVFLGSDDVLRSAILPAMIADEKITAINNSGPILDLIKGGPQLIVRQDNGENVFIRIDPASNRVLESAAPPDMNNIEAGELVTAAAPDGRFLAWNNMLPKPQTLEIIDLDTGLDLSIAEFGVEEGFNSSFLTTISWSPDQARIAAGGRNGSVYIWNSSTGNQLFNAAVYRQQVNDIVWSPDGSLIAIAGSDGNVNGGFQVIHLLHVSTGQLIREFALDFAHTALELTFSPDGQLLASGGSNGDVHLWDASSGARLSDLVGHKLSVTGIAFSPDGQVIVTSSRDGTIRAWGIPLP